MAASQLMTRIIAAAVLLAGAVLVTVLAASWRYGGTVTIGAVFVITGLSAFEMARLFSRDSRTLRYLPLRGSLIFVALLLPLVGAAWSALSLHALAPKLLFEPFSAGLGAGIALLCAVMCWAGRNDIEEAALLGKGLGIGSLFLIGGSATLITISGMFGALGLIWWLVGVVALGDTAAYFSGKHFGGPKLAPALSPNKTVSGSVGGFLASGLFGALAWTSFVDPFGMPLCGLLIAMIVAASAQIGDLTKSYLKRLRGVKDFGAIIPGHGGVLDRCDGLLGGAMVFLPLLILFVL